MNKKKCKLKIEHIWKAKQSSMERVCVSFLVLKVLVERFAKTFKDKKREKP